MLTILVSAQFIDYSSRQTDNIFYNMQILMNSLFGGVGSQYPCKDSILHSAFDRLAKESLRQVRRNLSRKEFEEVDAF